MNTHHIGLTLFCFGTLADYVSTQIGLRRGFLELNAVLGQEPRLSVVYWGLSATFFLAGQLWEHGDLFMGAIGVAHLLAAAFNARTLSRK
jgi:hypothetical protein